jgi:hypothetical protein
MSKLYVDAITNREGANAVNFPDGITGIAATFSGNVSIGGTLTYEDVTNIDSVGVITARSGINVTGGGAVITGVITATSFDGSINTAGIITASSFSGDGSGLTFPPKIIAFDPLALGLGIAVDTNITITFDQNIQFAGTGTIEIRSSVYSGPNSEWTANTGTLVESFAITSGTPASGLSISGTQLIINPTSDLPTGSTIYVILPSQGIQGTSGNLYYAGSNNYTFRTVASSFSVQGGDHVYTLVDGSSPTGYYKYHVFTSANSVGLVTFSADTSSADDLKIMLLAGGGAGAGDGPPSNNRASGGGGGAGGLLQHTGPTLNLPSGTYTVTVGAGGTAIPYPSPNPIPFSIEASNGRPSRLDGNGITVQASGGGGGGGGNPTNGPVHTTPWPGAAGGSGGGGGGNWINPPHPGYSTDLNSSGGGGIPGQGNAGGTGHNLVAAAHLGIPVPSRAPTPGNQFPTPYDVGVSGGGGGAGGAGGQGSNLYTWNPSNPTSFRTSFIGGQGGNGLAVPEFSYIQLNGNVPTIPTDTLTSIGPTGLYGGGGGGVGAPGPGQGAGGLAGPGGGGVGSPAGATAQNYLTAGYSLPNNGADRPGKDFQGGGGGGSTNNEGYPGGQGLVILRYAVPGT